MKICPFFRTFTYTYTWRDPSPCSLSPLSVPAADRRQDAYSEPRIKGEHLPGSVELPSLRDQFRQDESSSGQANRPRELLPSILAHSPPGRYASLPPIQRSGKLQRPRKSSIGQNARKPKHDRTKSKDFSRRLSMEGRKAMSAEPPTAAWVQGKRWEDLIEAATSATEADDDRDLTPVSFIYPWFYLCFKEHFRVVAARKMLDRIGSNICCPS